MSVFFFQSKISEVFHPQNTQKKKITQTHRHTHWRKVFGASNCGVHRSRGEKEKDIIEIRDCGHHWIMHREPAAGCRIIEVRHSIRLNEF